MKVLLTGADGFLGSHILRALLVQNHTVRAFLQAERSHATIAGLQYEPFIGDLLNRDDLARAIAGCEVVINAAGVTDLWPPKNTASWQVNYEAVKSLSEACQQNNIKKLIHIGSANSFGYGTKESPGTESSPYNFAKYHVPYIESKKAAQDYLLQEFRDHNLPVVIINPTFMVGEYDTKPGSGAMLLAVAREQLPGYAKGGRCIAYAGDVAVAAANAIERGRPGECYIAGGSNLNYYEFFQIIADCASARLHDRLLPAAILIPVGALCQIISKLNHKPPALSISMARISRDGHYYDSQKAISQLAMPQTSIQTAVQRSIGWFRANGYLPAMPNNRTGGTP